MHEEVFRALQDGATIITASRRLARVLARGFHFHQKARGCAVWQRPDILPLEAFLDRTWREWLWRGGDGESRVLLNPLQEQLVWEQIIRESPAGETLLRIPETARQAIEAWQLIQAYRLPVDGRFEASDDWVAFAAWSRNFRQHCQAGQWLERARLADFLAQRIASGELSRPRMLYRAGFDDLTPQQLEFFATLGECRELETPAHRPAPQGRKLRDATEEIRSSAAWARRLLESHPDAQIGIIVPDLARLRSKVERIFREALDSAAQSADHERSFHLSLGPLLGDYPVVRAALLILDFGLGPLPLPQAGLLLRSPFLGGAETEWTRRAQLDAKLRRDRSWDISVAHLSREAAQCPQLQRVLRQFEKELQTLPAEQRASEWSRDVARLLAAAGWPGDRLLSSAEFQTLQAWRGALSNLAALDLATAPLSFTQALDRLRDIVRTTVFQVENEGAPVQIMGLLEASGLRFDHLWIMGLHDEALPQAVSLNPFLPSSLQRDYKLPRCSAGRELAFATRLLERLIAGAPDLVLSYPETEGDRVLAPSPLVDGVEWLAGDAARPGTWISRMRAASQFEEFVDDVAPPLVPEAVLRGGTRLFKDMAACPFRAFAIYRLAARPLEDRDLGLSYADRGTSVHRALELIWAELGSRARLLALSSQELQAVVARHVQAAVEKLGPGLGRDVERRRLEKLLAKWMESEKARSDFSVSAREEKCIVSIGGLEVQTRADRIDELPGGRQIILDYKTGQVSASAWEGDRPDDPQLPLYCATSDRPLAGAAFAIVRSDELAFRGLAEDHAGLTGIKPMRVEQPLPFSVQVAEWKRTLEKLAEKFLAGLAQVDPKPNACDNCGLRALCRIREFENASG